MYHESAAELADLAELMPSPGRAESKKFEWAVSEWVHDTVPHARVAVVDEDTEEITGVQVRFNKHIGKRMKFFGSQVLIAGIPPKDKNAAHNGMTAELLESVKQEGAYASMYRMNTLSLNGGSPIDDPSSAGTTVKISEKYCSMDASLIAAETNPWTVANGQTHVLRKKQSASKAAAVEEEVSDCLLYTVTFYANLAHSLTRSP